MALSKAEALQALKDTQPMQQPLSTPQMTSQVAKSILAQSKPTQFSPRSQTIMNLLGMGTGEAAALPGPIGALASLIPMLPGVATGAAEAGARSGQALASFLGAPFGIKLPPADIYKGILKKYKGTPEAKAGEVGGTLVSLTAAPEAIGGLLKGAPAIARILGSGIGTAAITPGGPLARVGAGIAGTVPGIVEGLKPVLEKTGRLLSDKKLGDFLVNLANKQHEIADKKYSRSFIGTENIKPNLSDKTKQLIDDFKGIGLQKTEAGRSLRRFENNQTLEGLHKFKSDLFKLVQKADKGPGVSGTQEELVGTGNELINNLSKDLEDNMQKAGPWNYQLYRDAQDHWRRNVIPFSGEKMNAIRDLVYGSGRITPKIREELSTLYTDAVNRGRTLPGEQPAIRLREMAGMTPGSIKRADLAKNLAIKGAGIAGAAELFRHAPHMGIGE